MGIGQMTIPLFISNIPAGMSITIHSITPTTPSNMWSHMTFPGGLTLPHTFTAADIEASRPSNNRGSQIVELQLRTNGAFDSGDGGSFHLTFSISGRPDEFPDAELLANKPGTLTISTSKWGKLARPDQTHFVWVIDGASETYSEDTPTLTYLDNSCILLSWHPEKKAYVFGVTNQADFVVGLMQNAVSLILTGHNVLWATAGGWVCSIGGTAVKVVAFGAAFVNKM